MTARAGAALALAFLSPESGIDFQNMLSAEFAEAVGGFPFRAYRPSRLGIHGQASVRHMQQCQLGQDFGQDIEVAVGE